MIRFLLPAVTASVCLVALSASSPEAAAAEFYKQHQSMKLSGLPDAKNLQKLAPWLSSSLRKLLDSARQEQARCAKAFQDEKPPWVDDDLFTSNSEGFTTFRVNPAGAASGRVTVQFEYVEKGHRFAWRDDVAMVREGGGWRLDDVFFRQSAESLRAGLSVPGCSR